MSHPEIYDCENCQQPFKLNEEGIVANPCYVDPTWYGPWHTVELDEKVYLIELHHWNTCYNCCRKLVAEGKAKIVPPKECFRCHNNYKDVYGWDGSEVELDGGCLGGYGSTTFDMEYQQFNWPPGWYCYKCLDGEIQSREKT